MGVTASKLVGVVNQSGCGCKIFARFTETHELLSTPLHKILDMPLNGLAICQPLQVSAQCSCTICPVTLLSCLWL